MVQNCRKRIPVVLIILIIALANPAILFASSNTEREVAKIALDTFYNYFADKQLISNCFTVGDTKDRVRVIMGEPSVINDISGNNYWKYGSSYIYFNDSDKVIAWLNTGNLLVSLGNIDYTHKGFSLGSEFRDVVKAMGTPDEVKYDSSLNQLLWKYGNNTIFFNAEGVVIGWLGDGTIKANMGKKIVDAPAITVGSTRDDVIKAMGTPTSIYESGASRFWSYGISNIYFDDEGKVISWSNLGRNLKVSLGDADPAGGIFGIGSTKSDVLKVMGTPDYMFESLYTSYWRYGNSRVEFDRNGVVKAWYNTDFNLKVSLGGSIINSEPITFDSTKNDVIKAMGTPWAIVRNGDSEYWSYGLSTIRFIDDRVISWYNVNNNLKVGLPSEKDIYAPPFTLGSTKEDVAKVMGPPVSSSDSKEGSSWFYGHSAVYFGPDQKVKAWSNVDGQLKLKLGPDQLKAGTFTLGSSSKDVLECMGTPSAISNCDSVKYWNYGISTVYFDENDRVISWSNLGYNLKVSLGSKDESAAPFTLGSDRGAVIKAMGTPQIIGFSGDRQYWTYNASTVYFDKSGKVSAWDNYGDLKVSMGYRDPQAQPFTFGSSMQDVIKAMGTPDSIKTDTFSTYWRYGWSIIYFDKNGKVIYWDNTGGNLKVVK